MSPFSYFPVVVLRDLLCFVLIGFICPNLSFINLPSWDRENQMTGPTKEKHVICWLQESGPKGANSVLCS